MPQGSTAELLKRVREQNLAVEFEDELPVPSTQPESVTAPPEGWPLRVAKTGARATADVGIGVAKEAGDIVTQLGNILRAIPGVSQLDKVVAPFEFSTEAEGAAQELGKRGAQVAEFVSPLPGGKVKAGLKAFPQIAKLRSLLTDPRLAKNPQARAAVETALRKLTKSTPRELATSIAKEGGRAAAVSGLHGDENPLGGETRAAALGPIIGEAASRAAPALTTGLGRDLAVHGGGIAGASILGALMSALTGGGFGASGVGGALGGYGAATKAVRRILNDPQAVSKLQWAARRGSDTLGRVAAALIDQYRSSDSVGTEAALP